MFARTTTLIGSIFAAAFFAAGAGAATLPVTPGDYVRGGGQCHDAPLAALITYDGQNFHGAHSSDCVSTILSASGRHYKLMSTCQAEGDGRPTMPYTETQSVRIQSPSSFEFTHVNGSGKVDRAEYRLCEGGAS